MSQKTLPYFPLLSLSSLFSRPSLILHSRSLGLASAVRMGLFCNSAASISFSLSSLAASIYLGIACLFKIKGAYISRAAFPEPCVALLSSGRLRKYRAPGTGI